MTEGMPVAGTQTSATSASLFPLCATCKPENYNHTMLFWKKPKPVDYNKLIKDLEMAEWSTLKGYLAFNDQVNYCNGVESMIAKMRPPVGISHRLSLFKVLPNRDFELAIFQTPWQEGKVPYLSLIMCKANSLFYGIMLPFNHSFFI